MTTIKRKKTAKICFSYFACKISCHHYTMSKGDDIVMGRVIQRGSWSSVNLSLST